jgi:hypothetical protein
LYTVYLCSIKITIFYKQSGIRGEIFVFLYLFKLLLYIIIMSKNAFCWREIVSSNILQFCVIKVKYLFFGRRVILERRRKKWRIYLIYFKGCWDSSPIRLVSCPKKFNKTYFVKLQKVPIVVVGWSCEGLAFGDWRGTLMII